MSAGPFPGLRSPDSETRQRLPSVEQRQPFIQEIYAVFRPSARYPEVGDGQSGEEVTAPTSSWLHGEAGHGGLREFL